MSIEAIKKYNEEIKNIRKKDEEDIKELDSSSLFYDLLKNYTSELNIDIIQKQNINLDSNARLRADAIIKKGEDILGFIENKNRRYRLDKINNRMRRFYPTTNTIFENTERIVLYQSGSKVLEALYTNKEDVDKLINSFITFSSTNLIRIEILEIESYQYYNDEDYEKSIECCENIITLDPYIYKAYYNIGLAYEGLNQDEEALVNYEQIPTSNQYYDLAQIQLGTIYERKEEYDKALKFYEKIDIGSKSYSLAQANTGRVRGIIEGKRDIANEEVHKEYENKIKELNAGIKGNRIAFFSLVALSIVVVITFMVINITGKIYFVKETIDLSANFDKWDWIRLNITTTSIVGLILWVARYFNRRTHEDIHMREEYNHRKILLKTFKLYGEYIKTLSPNNDKPLLDFTEKTSSTINRSPANSLNRKKGDNIPISETLEIIQSIQKHSNDTK